MFKKLSPLVSLYVAVFACFLASMGCLHAQKRGGIPLQQMLQEADAALKGGDYATVIAMMTDVVARISGGESVAGTNIDDLRLMLANAYFQTQNNAKAEEILKAILAGSPSAKTAEEARYLLGLGLARQEKFVDAIPIFDDLSQSSIRYRDKALRYKAMCAHRANQLPVAIDAYSKLLRSNNRDGDWADAALTLISLHIENKNLETASEGLEFLRKNLDILDNYVGLNILSLQLGNALFEQKKYELALTAFRTVSLREKVLSEQETRTKRLTEIIAKQESIKPRNSEIADMIQNAKTRLEQIKERTKTIEEMKVYDTYLYYSMAVSYQELSHLWEAIILYTRILDRYPTWAEREKAHFGLVKCYSTLGRISKVKTSVDAFLAEFPNSDLVGQAVFLAALAVAPTNDTATLNEFLKIGVSVGASSPKNKELRQQMLMMQANAFFTGQKYESARDVTASYITDFPDGLFLEDASYMNAMAELVLGNTDKVIVALNAYNTKFPEGRFRADADLRLAMMDFVRQQYEPGLKRVNEWLEKHTANHTQAGEAYSLSGDIYAGMGEINDAIESYKKALEKTLSDEQLGYVLDEITKHYQSLRRDDEAAIMWEKFANDKPDHPFVINAAYWIGRIRTREGKIDQALEKMSNIVSRFISDPSHEQVERLLLQMAQVLARPPKLGPDRKRPPGLSDDEMMEKIKKILITANVEPNDTSEVRVLFTAAETASLRKKIQVRDDIFKKIGQKPFIAHPPGILGRIGDYILEQGNLVKAKEMYQYLVTRYPKSIFADFGYVGLGEIAYREKDFKMAHTQFSYAIDIAGARFKLKEATIGRAKSLFELNQMVEAKELFEQVASNRSWRGEPTALSLYYLGEISAKKGGAENLAQAQAHFQRVYISYKKFGPWVAKSYIRSAEVLLELGKKQDAVNTYRELLRQDHLAKFPENAIARERANTLDPIP